jgi:hypothetical protein
MTIDEFFDELEQALGDPRWHRLSGKQIRFIREGDDTVYCPITLLAYEKHNFHGYPDEAPTLGHKVLGLDWSEAQDIIGAADREQVIDPEIERRLGEVCGRWVRT